MIRRLTTLFFAVAALVHAQTSQPEINAERAEYTETEAIARGKAELRDADLLLTADEIRYNRATDIATARGNVVYTRGPLRLLADEVIVNRATRTFSAQKLRLGSYPLYVQGASAEGSRDEITVHDARISFGEPGPWQPTASAGTLTVSGDGKRIKTEGAHVGVGPARPLPFPKFEHNLADPVLSNVSLTGGYRRALGAFIDAGVLLPVAPGVRAGGSVGYYTERGVLAGPGLAYNHPTNPDRLRGLFRSGYINDHGDKKTDVLGRPVPENRGFVEWEHRQMIGDDLTLTGQFNWWKDSEVMRDFRPRQFFPVQQPDSFVEATYANPNSFVSLFTRLDPNSFQMVQQRLPELRFDLLPLALPGGFYERFNASIAVLREDPLPGVTIGRDAITGYAGSNPRAYESWSTLSPYPAGAPLELRATRLDAYYSLMRPIVPNNWVAFTPVAGARVTHYADTRGATQDGSYTRALGEVGFDAELRSSGTFAYSNKTWRIDGLRHLFTPRVSYRYIPRADRGREQIPLIDRETFSTYLPPLGLGDRRAVDQLHATNTLRVGFDNAVQTRDPKLGTRDLLLLNVAQDFHFKRRPGERESSEIHTDLAAMPASWLEFGLYSSFVPQSFTMREFNSGITIRDGRAWRVRFANNFLRHELQDYMVDGRARLNEEFDVLALVRYDHRKHRFTEQSYGVVQNLANTWRISYLISFYSGRRRESGFGFSVQVDTVRF